MRKVTIWKKTILTTCIAGLLVFSVFTRVGNDTAWAAPSKGTAVSGDVNVRDSANGTLIASLKEGQEVSILEEMQSGDGYTWYKISFLWGTDEMTGWVRSDLLNTAGADTQDEPDGEEPSSTEGAADISGNGDGTFAIGNDTYKISQTIPQDELPEGFSETTITYAGKEVKAAKFDTADLFLLYLEGTSGSDFYVYDSERDTVVPFLKKKTGNGYAILINVPVDIANSVSGDYTAGTCSFSGGSVIAYQQTEAADDTASDIDLSDFYYIYGVSDSGQAGWYLYDAGTKSLQRSIANMQYSAENGTDQEEAAAVFDADSIIRMIIAGLGIICVLLVALVIVFSVRYRRLRNLLEEECEEDGDLFNFGKGSERAETGSLETARAGKESPEKAGTGKESPEKAGTGKESSETAGVSKENPEAAGAEKKVRQKTVETASVKSVKPHKKQETVIPEASSVVNASQYQKKTEKGKLAVELPNAVVDLLDFDDEFDGGYDIPVAAHEDYDLTSENTPEDEKEFEELERLLYQNLSAEIKSVQSTMQESGPAAGQPDIPAEKADAQKAGEEEPEYYDDEENTDAKANWDDLEFL